MLNYKFVSQGSDQYYQAVHLRIALFFPLMKNAKKLINDEYETKSFHLVSLDRNEVVLGTGRLTIQHPTGIISQMAISEEVQKQGVGTEIMNIFITKCTNLNLEKIELSARKTAIGFYKKFGFKTIGPEYPSSKTGIPHQKMIKSIASENEFRKIYNKDQ